MIEAVDNALLGTFQDLNVNGLRIRSDNGSQLTLSGYEKHLRTLRIKHETIHAHTPEEDGHILLRIRLRSDNKSMEKHLYRGRVKGGGVFNLLPIPEVTIW